MSMNWMGGFNHSTNSESYFYTKHITVRSLRAYYIRLELHPYDLWPWLKVMKHLIYI